MNEDEPDPIALIIPMEEEASSLVERYFHSPPASQLGSDVFEGTIGNQPIILVRCGIGKVNASSAAATAILGWSPSAILVSGVAGALDASLRTGDIVVSTGALDHHLDLTPFIRRPGCLPGMASPVLPASLPLVESAVQAARTAASRTSWQSGSDVAVHTGVFATGDVLVSSKALKTSITKRFPEAMAVDMETAAVAQVALSAAIPWVCARVISDLADESFDPREVLSYAASEAADVIAELLVELANAAPD